VKKSRAGDKTGRMSPSDREEFKRLILQIERDLVATARLRVLLADAEETSKLHKRELRRIGARNRTTRG
jgi:hypothetical protein